MTKYIQYFLLLTNLLCLIRSAWQCRQDIITTTRNMKKLGFYLRLTLAFIVIGATRISAQDVVEFPEINTLTPENIFDVTFQPLYSALIVLFGYLSAYIPGVKKMNAFLRVLTFGLLAGLGFYLFGAPIWKVALTYLLTTGLIYDGFLKPLTKIFQKAPAKASTT